MKAVMYGAGNIGRGFIGQVFAASGYELIFIDVDEKVVDALNREGRYPVRILGEDSTSDAWIQGVSAINGRNEEEAAEAIASADIMATAVGVRVLPHIAPVIAKGLKKRFAGGEPRPGGSAAGSGGGDIKPLNIIICENLIDANRELELLIKKNLDEEGQNIFDKNIGLVEASIGRMVPLQTEEMRDGNPLRICVEAYSFLPVDKMAFKGEIPSLKGMCPYENFDFYIKRKLFVHNLGHAVCAYLGMIQGDNFIFEAAGSGAILYMAQNAMLESALALSAKYNEPLSGLHFHIRDLLRRFSNKALGDTCARVGADTKRKLGKNDRLVGALLFCAEEGINPVFISIGVAAAVYCHLNENGMPQNSESALAVLKEVSGINGETENNETEGNESIQIETILLFHSMLASIPQNGSFDEIMGKIINAASRAGQRQDVI